MALDTKEEGSLGISSEFIEKRVRIGDFPIPLGQPALTANIAIYLEFTASGSVSLNYSVESVCGFEYVNNRFRRINKSYNDFSVQAEAEVEAGIRGAVELRLIGMHLADMNARVGVGGSGNLTIRAADPYMCVDLSTYVYLQLSALKEGVINDLLDLNLEYDIWNKDKSPFKKFFHLEGITLTRVPYCTFDIKGEEGEDSEEGENGGKGGETEQLPYDENLSFEDKVAGWNASGDVRIISSLGVLEPTDGNKMIIAGTGFGAVQNSHSILYRQFTVPSNMKYLILDYNFVSEEPMKFVDTRYDDTLIINLIVNDEVYEIKRESVNTSQWICIGCGNEMPKDSNVECCTGPSFDYFPGGKDSTYHIDWQTLSIDISDLTEFTLELQIYDKGDSIFDSAVLLDNLRFSNKAA